jgi:hypothetical protein
MSIIEGFYREIMKRLNESFLVEFNRTSQWKSNIKLD